MTWKVPAPMIPKKPQIRVELQDWMGDDRAIANAAWTSSHERAAGQIKSLEDVERVIRHMAKNKHSTPFESVIFRFWYRWPIFTDRQHMTHRIASHNGLSGRYRTLPSEYLALPKDVKDIISKAMPSLHGTDAYVKDWFNRYDQVLQEAQYYYKELLGQMKTAEK